MKNKKSLIAIIAVLLVVVVGVTFAYFQSTGTFENVFQTGIYKLTTTEEFVSPDNWAPGQEIPKTITTTNEGTIPAAVRVSYTEQWLDGENDITSSIEEGSAIINFDNRSDWISENGYYYYKYILNPGETTSSFIKSVTLNEDLDDINCVMENQTQVCESTSPALGATYKLTITKETVQANAYQNVWNTNVEIIEKPNNVITYLRRQVDDQITPGDKIGIGETEDFYVVNSNSEKTILLAEYNLLVGKIVENNQIIGNISDTTPGYGLQSLSAAAGYANYNSYGSIEFSNDLYWNSTNTLLLDKYSKNGQICYNPDAWSDYETHYMYSRDSSQAYPYVYDENSLIYQYISGTNGYVDKLIEMGAPSTITGRLLTYDEANYMKDITNENGVSIIYSNNGDYWIGSISNYNKIYAVVNSYGFLYGFELPYNKDFGIRPVIEIPTSALQ